MKRRLLILGLVLLCYQPAFLCAQPSYQAPPTQSISRADPVPAEFFGLIIHRAHTTTRWPTVPFGAWRLWDSYIKWSDIQPLPGTWRFGAFDRQVALGEQHHKELIYTFGQTPAWASIAAQEKHAWGMGTGGMPKSIDDWISYVEKVVRRYKGRVYAYEVWNEPQYMESGRCRGAIFFCGSPEDLVRLTRTAHEIIKRVDPKALLATPGFSGGIEGVNRLDRYLAEGGAKYVEAISFHFYELHPERNWETILALRSVMEKHGLSDLPIWNTEIGYLINNQDQDLQREHDLGPFSVVFSPKEGAVRLARAMIVAASGGIDRVYWYAWDDKRMGMVGSRDGIPHEMATAYRVTRQWLLNSIVSCSTARIDGLWRCQLKRDGRSASLLWSGQNEAATFLLPIGNSRSIEDLADGRKIVNGGERLEWHGGPVLIADSHKAW